MAYRPRRKAGIPAVNAGSNSVTKKPRAKPVQRERGMQVALFKWAHAKRRELPALALMFAIPNGGKRDPIIAARMSAEGVKRGVPDIFLPFSRDGRHGLFIELKAGKNTQSPEQKGWEDALVARGFDCVVVRDNWMVAADFIEAYLLGLDLPFPTP